MKSRGFALAARLVGITVVVATCLSFLVTLCWGELRTPGRMATSVLGPSARAAALSATRSQPLTPGLVNLTHSPADERLPAWSPNGELIAFTSNGSDTNGDGQIDTIVQGQRFLFTMRADGSGLVRYPLLSGSVSSLTWRPDSLAIYFAVSDAGSYAIREMNLDMRTATDIYTSNTPITNITVSPNGALLFFDKMTADGKTNIFVMPLQANATPTQLTAGAGNNRRPALSTLTGEVVFESDRTGRWRIYRMGTDGSNQQALTVGTAGGDDTGCRVTVDGQLVFSSTRLTGNGDLNYDGNVWVMPYAQEGSGTPPLAPAPRFFADYSNSSFEVDPAPQVVVARKNDLLFASNQDGTYDIFSGSLEDTVAPYISAAPTASPKVTSPGSVVTITVPVVDLSSGVRNVWLQIKDPDPASLDSLGTNHVITRMTTDWRAVVNGDTNDQMALTEVPVEYGPFDPVTNSYLDTALPASHPGYYARAGAARIFTDEGQGYPEVPQHWLQMYDDGTHGDVTAGDGTYTVKWTTPNIQSDWFFDVIVEDTINAIADTQNRWHGNRMRYDNVGGCSTKFFTGGKRILLVDDYADGQRFLSQGLPPTTAQYDSPAFLTTFYYFAGASGSTPVASPFSASGEFGAADVWRLLARGPVSEAVLTAYQPSRVTQVSAVDGRSPIITLNGDKVVVWVTPSSWYRLIKPVGASSGSLIETSVQSSITNFINAGGRFFAIGADLATGLTNGGNTANAFLSQVLGAALVNQSVPVPTGGIPAANFEMTPEPVPSSLLLNTEGYNGNNLAQPRVTAVTALPRNDNPSQYVTYSTTTGGTRLVWDTLKVTAGATAVLYLPDFPVSTLDDTNSNIVGVSHDLATGGRTIFWSFGYEHLSAQYRARPALDALEWLFDGSVAGTVAQVNDLKPIPDALVQVTEIKPPILVGGEPRRGRTWAVRTNARGEYIIHGIKPGKNYTILNEPYQYELSVSANGYYGTNKKDIVVLGGKILSDETTAFFLYRDVNTANVFGTVTQSGQPVPNATVTASPIGGSETRTTVTDGAGNYQLANLPSGQYMVSALNPQNNATATAPTITIGAGESRRVDLQFSATAPQPRLLAGAVSGAGMAIPGATVQVTKNGDTVAAATSDQNGKFAIADLPADNYLLIISAPGYITTNRAVTFDPISGAFVSIELTPVAEEPTNAHIYGRIYNGNSLSALGGATIQVLVGSTVIATKTSSDIFQTGLSPYNFDFVLTSGVYTLKVTATGRQTQLKTLNLSPGQIVNNIEFHMAPLLTVSPGVILFSLPGDYTNQSMLSVLGMPEGDTNRLHNRVATYNTALSSYQYYTMGAPLNLQPATAYWIRLDQAATVQNEGAAVDTSKPFERAMSRGWTLIGNPFPFVVDLFDCTVVVRGIEKSWSEAIRDGDIGNAVYTWNGAEYVPNSLLQPYLGYWIYAVEDCTLNIANRSSLRSVPVTRQRRAATNSDWQIRLVVRAGDARDSANYFGVAPGLKDTFDNQADTRKPPLPLGNYAQLAFSHREWGVNAGEFASDMRAPSAGEMRWSFHVDTNQPNTDVILSWPELQAQLPGGYQAILIDQETKQRCYLNTTSQYSFKSGATGGTRAFEVVVSPRTGSVLVSDVRGINGGSGRAATLIAFTLTQDALVKVNIRNQTGKLVRTLITDLHATTGINNVTWDRLDNNGRRVAAGLYLCEVIAIDPATYRQARGNGLLSLSRQQVP